MVMKVYIFFPVRWRSFFGKEMYFPNEDRENHVSAAHIAIADLRTAACMLKGYLKLQVSQVQRVLHSSTSSWMSKIQFKHIKDNPNYKETTKHKNAFPQNSTISNSKLQTWLQIFVSQKIRKYQQKKLDSPNNSSWKSSVGKFFKSTIHAQSSLIPLQNGYIINTSLGGGFNPFETYAQVKLDHETPQIGMKRNNIWVATT